MNFENSSADPEKLKSSESSEVLILVTTLKNTILGLKELVIHGWLCCNLSSIGLKYQCIVKWLDDGPLMPSPIFDWILNDVAFARYDSPDFVLVGDAL